MTGNLSEGTFLPKSNFYISHTESGVTNSRTRIIPKVFTCDRLDGIKCGFKTELEVVFRQHLLSHIGDEVLGRKLVAKI